MKECNKVSPKDIVSVLAVNCEGDQVEVDVDVLSGIAVEDVQNAVDSSSVIKILKQTDNSLKLQIDLIKDIINRRAPDGASDDSKGLKQRLDEAAACCANTNKEFKSVYQSLSEILSNITALKSWNTRQDEKIDSLE